jgi:hypothetical protein
MSTKQMTGGQISSAAADVLTLIVQRVPTTVARIPIAFMPLFKKGKLWEGFYLLKSFKQLILAHLFKGLRMFVIT